MMDFIIGHMLRLYAKVTQIIFFSFIFILAQHIGGAVSTHGKTPQTWSKKYQISKLAENPSKSGKRLKPKAIPLFLRDVGLIKVVLKFSFWPFFLATFAKSAHLYVSKNGTSVGCRNGNFKTTFIGV